MNSAFLRERKTYKAAYNLQHPQVYALSGSPWNHLLCSVFHELILLFAGCCCWEGEQGRAARKVEDDRCSAVALGCSSCFRDPPICSPERGWHRGEDLLAVGFLVERLANHLFILYIKHNLLYSSHAWIKESILVLLQFVDLSVHKCVPSNVQNWNWCNIKILN